MPVELESVYYRESIPRKVPGYIRVIQALLYLAVLIFTVMGSMQGLLWAILAVGTLLGAWLFMGTVRIEYEYCLDGMTFSVIRHSGMRSRPKSEEFLLIDLANLVIMADEGAEGLEPWGKQSAAASPRRITYDVSAHDAGRGCSVLYAMGSGGEAGRWLKVYLQPTSELISWLRRLCPGKVAAHAEE